MIGVYSEKKAPIVAQVLAERGTNGLVFRGDNGMDELSAVTGNTVWEVRDGGVQQYRFEASEIGIAPATVDDLRGGDATYNADVARRVMAGERGAVRDAVCLNAAGAFLAYGSVAERNFREGTFSERMQRAYDYAQEVIDSGKAAQLLNQWIEISRELSEKYPQ